MRIASIPSRVRHDERGMTLPELMIGIMAGMIVLAAGYAAMTIATQMQVRTTDRIDATARGRTAVNRITRMIRSQQCLDSNTPAMQWAGDVGLQFYASVADATDSAQPVERRRILWTKKGQINGVDVGDIVETTWRSTTSVAPYAFPTTPLRTSILAEDVESDGGAPFFTYYGYGTGTVGRPSSTPFVSTNALPISAFNPTGKGVADANLPRIVLVEMRFAARPRSDKLKTFTVPFFNRVAVRTADPSDPTRSPLCL